MAERRSPSPRHGFPRQARARQHGVALITVLLVVALATVAAVEMTRRNQFDQRRTGNRLALLQAHEVALGGERWAAAILARDLREGDDPPIDSRDEDWARVLPPIPIEGGQVTGRIEDMRGRFNINSLVEGDTIDALALERFERLLAILEVETDVAQAVVDWVDANSDVSFPAGAEDDYYSARGEPYLAANRPLAVASELRLVRGIDREAWQRLAPHVTAVAGAGGEINVNTATSAVLRAVVPGLDEAGATALREAAAETPFETVGAFGEHPLVEAGATAADDAGLTTEGLAVASTHFRTRIDVELGPITYTLYSWLERDDNGASRVLRRTRTAH